jgi:hypothetical protein
VKRKNSADYTVERVYNFILNCGGIASGSVIAKTLHISESWAQQCAREAIRIHDDIESIPGVGYGKKGIECSYYISAALFSHNDECVYGWEGPVFKRMSDIDKAHAALDDWWPPAKDVELQVDLWMTTHPLDTLELEITLFDGNDNELDSTIEEV